MTRWIRPLDDTVHTSQARREAARRAGSNGLDSVEVTRRGTQLALSFLLQPPHHIGPDNIRIVAPPGQPAVRAVEVIRESFGIATVRDRMLVELDRAGGEGSYFLHLVETGADGRPSRIPLSGLDPWFVDGSFSFDIDDPNPAAIAVAPAPLPPPSALESSYLARDYEALRSLLLDRVTQTVPGWTERHAADLMVALVELLAYLGDDLSYQQDAVATEAYLQTARKRISLRRHGRLVGYRMHEGCHARAWVAIEVDDAVGHLDLSLEEVIFTAPLPSGSAGTTTAGAVHFMPLQIRVPGDPDHSPGWVEEPPPPVRLRAAHNEVALWTWGETSSTLPAGSTVATLAEPLDDGGSALPQRILRFEPGDVLVLEERHAGDLGAADPSHRHVVRLTGVVERFDPLYGRALLEIQWDDEDSLPFDLPLAAPDAHNVGVPCAVAIGNVVLVGEGSPVDQELLAADAVTLAKPYLVRSRPFPDLAPAADDQAASLEQIYDRWLAQIEEWRLGVALTTEPLNEDQWRLLRRQVGAERIDEIWGAAERSEWDSGLPLGLWETDLDGLTIVSMRADDLMSSRRRRLDVLARLARASGPLHGPMMDELVEDWGARLTRALDIRHPSAWGSATRAMRQNPRRAEPMLTLTGVDPATGLADPSQPVHVVSDIAVAAADEPWVLVESDDDGVTRLTFNPVTEPHGPLVARYQVGRGGGGNVDIHTITQMSPKQAGLRALRNPMPATGGVDPEPIEAARRAIPGASRVDQPRALSADEYATQAAQVPGVRSSAASLRWMGNRLVVRVYVQPAVGEDPSDRLLRLVHHKLRWVRRIGHEVTVLPPDYRPVVVAVEAHLSRDTLRADARAAIARLLGSRSLADGSAALFSPERVGFGSQVYASSIVAAVQELSGVVSVRLTRLSFLDATHRRADSVPDHLDPGPMSIIRVDNDPTQPENGYAQINIRGGR